MQFEVKRVITGTTTERNTITYMKSVNLELNYRLPSGESVMFKDEGKSYSKKLVKP